MSYLQILKKEQSCSPVEEVKVIDTPQEEEVDNSLLPQPKMTNLSYETWLIYNFSYLRQIRGIVYTLFMKKYHQPHIFEQDFDCKLYAFLYNVSSGKIGDKPDFSQDDFQLMDFLVKNKEYLRKERNK